MSNIEPEGDLVTGPPSLLPSPDKILTNNQHGVNLIPSRLDHVPSLFKTVGGPQNDHIYRYLPNGPYPELQPFTELIDSLINNPSAFPYTVFSKNPTHHPTPPSTIPTPAPDSATKESDESKYGTPIGFVLYLNTEPSYRSLEMGFVFSPFLQRTTAATQVFYLLLQNAFENLHYSRVEWKANNFNEPSKRAAGRLGFVFEGLFRKHMIVRGRRRDSWWGSIIDDEWDVVKGGLEEWLREDNFDEEGGQKRRLEDVREALKIKRGKEASGN